MYKNLFLGVFAALLLFSAVSCTKGKYNNPIGDRLKMLTGSTYRLNTIVDNGTTIAPGCKGDDVWYFKAGGHDGTIDDGTERCTTEPNTDFTYGITGDQRFLYIWNMSNPTTYGTYRSDSYRLDFEIMYMTATELSVKYFSKVGFDGKEHHYELMFVRIN